MKRYLVVVTVLFVALGMPAVWAGPLKDYVAKSDNSYGYAVTNTVAVDGASVKTVEMTSQTWQGIVWKHSLTIVKPAQNKFPGKALLLISGGVSSDEAPGPGSKELKRALLIASKLQASVALLRQVPNQPLFDGMVEDGIIAYTFEKFLKGEGEEWPLLLPMTKSAVRAMDTVQAVAKSDWSLDVKQFVVTGASKRGWTTWLTGAVDKRVMAIAPMVIDTLNFQKQMEHQLKAYGRYSEEIKDYTDRNLNEAFHEPKGRPLLDIVDPYVYLDDLKKPTMVLLGANDEYWTTDSARWYYNDLKGDKRIQYEPNAGHGLRQELLIPTLVAFTRAAMQGERLPNLRWRLESDGAFSVRWTKQDGKALLWQARSSIRDFRKTEWTSTELGGTRGVSTKLATPAQGWAAYFVTVEFPSADGDPKMAYTLSTLITVLPDTYPEHPAK